ncbi:APC family permease [Novosphingobium pokkalii]|uniref:APC family permease n=1 Tax=Novosphingobium pokkalii TaxID=1770194 RepID=A0ABV7UY99_9SPHN|nr:APC family permease [Novosphingobium pokkalii]GHC95614.1 porin [Novosphingobium pokkalii]
MAEAGGAGAGLQGRLGFWHLVGYGLALIAPTAPLNTLGVVWGKAHGLIALSYLLGGLCMAFTAASYAVMVREVRSAGSLYGFARAALGPFAGFMGGWMILLDYLMIPSLVYVIMAVALGQLMPEVDRAVWIVALLGFTTAVNWFGIRSTSAFNAVSVIAQIAVMMVLVTAGVLFLGPVHAFSPAPVWADPLPWQGVLAGTSVCVLSFLGFDAVSTLAEDTADRSGRTLGRAILAVLALATVFFGLSTWVLGNAMVGRHFASLDAAHYELAGAMLGAWARPGLAWFTALVVGFTNALPMQVGVARVLYAMGRDGQVPTLFARLHARHNTPWVAMLATTALSLVVALAFRDAMDFLATLVNFGALTGFALLHVCVFVRFRRSARRNLWLHVVSPLVGLAVIAVILSGMGAWALLLGCGWLALGLAWWQGAARHAPPPASDLAYSV